MTLTANYRETLNAHTVEFIDERIDENYALDDMLEFIDAHSEDDFCNYYEEYVRCGEAIGYEAVDALIEEMGDMSYIECCDERYRGEAPAVFSDLPLGRSTSKRFCTIPRNSGLLRAAAPNLSSSARRATGSDWRSNRNMAGTVSA